MPEPTQRPTDGALRVALANGVSHVVREYTGRGPVKARAMVSGDMALVLMHTSLTKAEKTLIEEGQSDLVYDRRRADQHAMRTAVKASVSDVTGRRVMAFMSADHIDPDMALEFFLLEPEPDTPAAAA